MDCVIKDGLCNMGNNKKFTLIELLVVVAIIGILASILLPSLAKARAKTIQAVCLSNQKQIHFAATMYSDANDEWFVRMRDSQTRSWQNSLHDAGVLEVPNSTASTNNGVLRRVQASKTFVIWCPAEDNHHPIADIGINGSLSWWSSGHSRVSQVLSPVDVVKFGDAYQSGTEYGEWFIHSPNWLSQGTAINAGGNPYPDSLRHLNNAVSVFVDGHGAYLSGKKVLSDRNTLYTGPLDTTNPDYN